MVGELATKEEKLKFLIKNYLKLSQKELSVEFDVTEIEMSKIINNREKKLKNVHLLGFCYLYDIPHEVFKNKKLNTEEKMRAYVDEYKNCKKREMQNKELPFYENNQLLKNLTGIWYAYLYPSNPSSPIETNGVWIVKTTITEDYKVIDEYNNEGILQLGKNQSLICKESNNEKNLTIIRFSNSQIAYKLFRFIIISNQNITNHEMVNVGFYSREKYSAEIAKEILGNINKVQLKLDLEFDERLSQLLYI